MTTTTTTDHGYTVTDRYPIQRGQGTRARVALVTLAETGDGLAALAVVECGGAVARKGFTGETAHLAARRWADDTAAALVRNEAR